MGIRPNIIFRALSIAAFLMLSTAAWAQPGVAPVEKVNGRKMYRHTVQSGHTLWAIAKMYSVTVTEIRDANPGVSDRLQIGQKILVPLDGVDKKEAKTAPTVEGGALIHTVAKNQTLYGICQKYSVKLEDLKKANPGLSDNLQIGQEIKIPVTAVEHDDPTVVELPVQAEDGFDRHTVQAGETVYGISKKYNVALDSLITLNEDVIKAGLKPGSVVRIPMAKVANTDSVIVTTPTEVITSNANLSKGTYNVAVFLPIYVQKNKAIKADPNPMTDKDIYPKSLWALDMYNGIRMAVDSLKSLGLSVNLNVYDTGKDSTTISRALTSPEMQNTHLIIGPLYNSSVSQISRYAKENNIHLVAPISQSMKRLEGQPNVSRTTASRTTQMEYLGSWLGTKYNAENVIMVKSKVQDADLEDAFRTSYQRTIAGKINNLNDSLVISRTESNSMKSLAAKFKADQLNVIVLPCTDEAYVSHFFTMMSALKEKTYRNYRFMICGVDKWLDYDGIDYDLKERYNVHMTAPRFWNHNELLSHEFIRDFRNRFNGADPGEFSVLGFDVAYFYLKGLRQYGTAFTQHFGEISTTPLATGFNMKRTGEGDGFENKEVYILRYQDYELEKVN